MARTQGLTSTEHLLNREVLCRQTPAANDASGPNNKLENGKTGSTARARQKAPTTGGFSQDSQGMQVAYGQYLGCPGTGWSSTSALSHATTRMATRSSLAIIAA